MSPRRAHVGRSHAERFGLTAQSIETRGIIAGLASVSPPKRGNGGAIEAGGDISQYR
jgi:hypothetical protein